MGLNSSPQWIYLFSFSTFWVFHPCFKTDGISSFACVNVCSGYFYATAIVKLWLYPNPSPGDESNGFKGKKTLFLIGLGILSLRLAFCGRITRVLCRMLRSEASSKIMGTLCSFCFHLDGIFLHFDVKDVIFYIPPFMHSMKFLFDLN